jgi:hypothetical protein
MNKLNFAAQKYALFLNVKNSKDPISGEEMAN